MEQELLATWFSVAAALVCHEAGPCKAPSNAGKKSTSLFTDKTKPSSQAPCGVVCLQERTGWGVRTAKTMGRAQAGGPAHTNTSQSHTGWPRKVAMGRVPCHPCPTQPPAAALLMILGLTGRPSETSKSQDNYSHFPCAWAMDQILPFPALSRSNYSELECSFPEGHQANELRIKTLTPAVHRAGHRCTWCSHTCKLWLTTEGLPHCHLPRPQSIFKSLCPSEAEFDFPGFRLCCGRP